MTERPTWLDAAPVALRRPTDPRACEAGVAKRRLRLRGGRARLGEAEEPSVLAPPVRVGVGGDGEADVPAALGRVTPGRAEVSLAAAAVDVWDRH